MKRTITALLLSSVCALTFAQGPLARSLGQQLYLPIYSHVWHGDVDKQGRPTKTLVSVSVSIRNTDPVRPIRVTSAQYYDTNGARLKDYVPQPQTIAPMGTLEIFVPRSDDSGGSGANFVIKWKAEQPTSEPVVEAFHANLPVGRSIAFTSTARVMPAD